ncbi:pumilio homolog 23 isoform X2 [Cynara cardunculus var. scolymus]|uniref:pumilio homolog 23 isoform X2 n=1 Tax=Cynara cardunculus var. scolymus TaxID=59895 RepID=UPI000D6314FA|nr:pumilio homolog 23 isoform X2 [Cynara cardunculus var. scolymus]
MGKKSMKKIKGADGDKNISGGISETLKPQKHSNHQEASTPRTSFLREQVDPETAKYFSEIANVIEGTEVDLEERSSICGNALEETRGKEVELATDYIISHTLQTLLQGCALDQLCTFLQNSSKDFPRISMDKSGSHVAETALRSLAAHLQESDTQALVEATLNDICQAIVANPVEVMTNCHGSHVLRSLLCLCKGMPFDSSDFHSKKPSAALAQRLNFKSSRSDGSGSQGLQLGFPDMLKFLVLEILKAARKDIEMLQVDQYGSLVLQTALKLLVGYDQELLHAIPVILGCNGVDASEGNLIDNNVVKRLRSLMKEAAFSHLMEVILEVAPEPLYNEIITKTFRNSLLEMSSHYCGNFVVQALISHARSEDHVELIWKELGTKFKDLFGMGKSGVVASLIAASHRLHSHEHMFCQALISAVCMENEPPRCIVPRILFLDNYFYCKDKSNWDWPSGARMHVIGTLILQSVFRLPSEFIHAFISSMTSLEEDHLLDTSKDSGGSRVIEAFLNSNASGKQKRKLVVKLKGHFGELSMLLAGSFTVKKCFDVSSVALREVIVSEMLAVQAELSKTKHGPHFLRTFDVEGYAKRPDQWKSRQTSRESAYNDFISTFGSKETTSSKYDASFTENRPKSQQEKLKDMRKEIDTHLTSSCSPFLAHKPFKMSGQKRHSDGTERGAGKFTKHTMEDDTGKSKQKSHRKRKHDG